MSSGLLLNNKCCLEKSSNLPFLSVQTSKMGVQAVSPVRDAVTIGTPERSCVSCTLVLTVPCDLSIEVVVML